MRRSREQYVRSHPSSQHRTIDNDRSMLRREPVDKYTSRCHPTSFSPVQYSMIVAANLEHGSRDVATCACPCTLFQAYRDIFEGRWEDWDPFKAGPRMRAAAAQASAWVGDGSMSSPGLEGGGRAPQPFRPFQGYLSLGRWGEKGNVSPACAVISSLLYIADILPMPFARRSGSPL